MDAESLRAALRAVALLLACAYLARWLVPSTLRARTHHEATEPSSAATKELPEHLSRSSSPKLEHDDKLEHNDDSFPSDDSEWYHSISLDGDQPLTVHTRVRRGELSFRFDATMDASIGEIISLARETDLMPVWNPYCAEAGVAKLNGQLDLFAWASFKFSPLPIPPMFVVVHATLTDRVSASGHWHVRVVTSPPAEAGGADALDRSALPTDVLTHGEVTLSHAVGRLSAVRRHPARSHVTAELAMDLRKLSVLGPIRFFTPPAWLVNTVTKIMIPGVWRACLEAIAKIQADGESGPIGARLAADTTRVYERIRRATGQAT